MIFREWRAEREKHHCGAFRPPSKPATEGCALDQKSHRRPSGPWTTLTLSTARALAGFSAHSWLRRPLFPRWPWFPLCMPSSSRRAVRGGARGEGGAAQRTHRAGAGQEPASASTRPGGSTGTTGTSETHRQEWREHALPSFCRAVIVLNTKVYCQTAHRRLRAGPGQTAVWSQGV